MANETHLTVIGNLTADPELRYTKSGGDAVVNFSVATTPRIYDAKKQEWADGEVMFLRCTAWKEEAENIAESFTKGQRIIVVGDLQAANWEDEEGNKRVNYEIRVTDVGHSLKFGTTEFTRVTHAEKEEKPAPKRKAKAVSRR